MGIDRLFAVLCVDVSKTRRLRLAKIPKTALGKEKIHWCNHEKPSKNQGFSSRKFAKFPRAGFGKFPYFPIRPGWTVHQELGFSGPTRKREPWDPAPAEERFCTAAERTPWR